ncbi:MAG TPA: tetratricopeptide repeat protein [Planctomycetota bacterium]|nr:tetratricopeptide repeat protein [Planctomycetota bacterium]
MGDREGEVTRVLKRVAQTLGSGKYDEALRDLLHLSEKYPDAGEIRPQIAEVLLRRGESRARKGKVKEARDDFERSLTWTNKPAALVAIARSLMHEGKLDQADARLNEALEIDDRYGPTHETLGILMLAWQEYAQAAKAFEEALGCGHSSPELYRAVWEVYMKLERVDRAHDLILEGADRFPKDDQVQATAGDSYVFAKGDSAEARPYWEKAIALNPNNFGALFNLAAEAADRGDRAASLGHLQRCAALDLERTRKLWKEDLASPMKKFGGYARDNEFRRVLGWEND